MTLFWASVCVYCTIFFKLLIVCNHTNKSLNPSYKLHFSNFDIFTGYTAKATSSGNSHSSMSVSLFPIWPLTVWLLCKDNMCSYTFTETSQKHGPHISFSFVHTKHKHNPSQYNNKITFLTSQLMLETICWPWMNVELSNLAYSVGLLALPGWSLVQAPTKLVLYLTLLYLITVDCYYPIQSNMI